MGNVKITPGTGGSPGAMRLMRDLVGKGWSPEAAAVMAGNVQVESGFNAGNHSGDGGTSWGLAQWHADRQRRLVALAKSKGVPWSSWDLQVGLMDQEWRERYGNAVTSHDFSSLARLGKKYEGYSTNSFGSRVGAATRFLHEYNQHKSGDETSGAIPPQKKSEITINHKTILDGRVVARSAMKHIVNAGNRPAQGGRLPDYSGTRPISV